MAEQTGSVMDGLDNAGKNITAYSVDGKRTEAEFINAIDAYNKTGKAPQGFNIIPVEHMNMVRKAFDYGNKYLQQGAKAIANSPNIPMTPGIDEQASFEQGSPATTGGPAAMLYNAVKSMAPAAADQVSTPEKLGATMGQVGANMLVPGVSIPMQIAAGTLGAVGGSVAGQLAVGDKVDVGKSMTSGLLAALSGGFTGIMKWATGNGMSQQAGEGTANKIMDYLKSQHGNLAVDPNILNIASTSKSDLSRITQIAMKGLRDDVLDLSRKTSLETMDAFQGNLGRDLGNTYRAQMKRIADASNSVVENVNDTLELNKARATIADATDNIVSLVDKAFKGKDKQAVAQAKQQAMDDIYNSMSNHVQELKDKVGTASVFRAVEKSSEATGGFNIRNFQDEIKGYYQQNPGSHLEAVGNIAGRGAPLTEGIDRTMINEHAIPSWIMGGFKTPAMGQRYIGKVESNAMRAGTAAGNVAGVNVLGNIGGDNAIKSFVSGDDNKRK